jgi:pimeloyl-ACP methyl ester carboxylesterase
LREASSKRAAAPVKLQSDFGGEIQHSVFTYGQQIKLGVRTPDKEDKDMLRKLFLMFTVLLIALMLLVLGGCGADNSLSNGDPAVLVSTEFQRSFSSLDEVKQALLEGGADKTTVSNTLGGYDTIAYADKKGAGGILPTIDIIALIGTVWNAAGFLPYLHTAFVDLHKIVYKQTKEGPELTGLLMMPRYSLSHYRGILLFTHPTETLRAYSPSVTKPFIDGTFTKVFGYLFGMLGYVVVIPDYPGMGDNRDTHPYCLTTLGDTSAAMIKAVKSKEKFGLSKYKDVYVIGFSEGGYAALASAYYMRNYPADYKVKKVAALSGPYDLSGTMKNLMITADTSYKAPYFLPYVINGYRAAYPDIKYLDFSTSVVAKPVIVNRAFNVRLQEMLYGDYSGSDISQLIYTVEPDSKDNKYYGPISIATSDFQKHLKDEPESALNKALAANTLARNDWYPDPTVDFLFAHYQDDDCVPYGNTAAMELVWGGYAKKTGMIHFKKLTDIRPFTAELLGSTHAASIVHEYIMGMKFMLGMPI